MKLIRYIFTALLLPICGVAFSQAVLTGKVVEKVGNTNEPMIGVNVSIYNAQDRSLGGAITDLDGMYRVQIPARETNITLVYSFIGMKTQRIKYTGQTVQNVTLVADNATLDEVVVTGQRTERSDMGISHKEMVGATQKVNMDELVSISPVSSIEEALQGQLAGVDIVAGGDPGARNSIRIRGISTLSADAEPLIVIDNVPYNINISDDFDFATANDEDFGALLNIAPADIESIEVLKDAAATAIWGTQGGNGVLLITTKKGKIGKTRFTFSTKFTTKIEPNGIPMLNGDQYTALMQEAIWNSAKYTGLANTKNQYIQLLYDTPEIGYNPNWEYFDEYNQNTNWLDEIRQTALSTDNSLSMSGGGEKATYRISMGYVNEGGTEIGTAFKRFTTSANITYDFSKTLHFTAQFSFAQSDRDANYSDGDYQSVRGEALSKMPNKSPYYIDEFGNRTNKYFSYFTPNFEGSGSYNPVAMVRESYNKTRQRESKITFNAKWNILPILTYEGYVSMNMSTNKNRKFLPQSVTGVPWTNTKANLSSDALSDGLSIQTENKLRLMKNWQDVHNIILTALWRTQQSENASYSGTSSGNASTGLSDPIVGSNVVSIGSGESQSRRMSGVFLANYTLLNRYVLQGTGTIESSSAMGKDQRFAFFPSVGFSWNIQNEPILAKAQEKWLDDAKLRVSWGLKGRAPSGVMLYQGAFSSYNSYMDMAAIRPSRMQLNNLKWETSSETNLGLDVALLKNRLKISFDWYSKYTKDMLIENYSLPSSTGYSSIKVLNSGESSNKGWEFRTDVVIIQTKDWRVSGSINFSRDINKLDVLPANMQQTAWTMGNGAYATPKEVGRPIGSFYGFRYEGVYQNREDTYARDAEGGIMNDVNGNPITMMNGKYTVYPGDAKYEDINHDGVINEYDVVYLGNFNPVLTGGAGLSVRYKDWNLTVNLHGRFGQKIINRARMNNEAMYNKNNQSTAVLGRWRAEGDQTDIPRALYNEGLNYLGSDRFVEDASFLRLKTVSLTYRIPKRICQRWGVNDLSVFVTGYDLHTWTKYTGQDPEVGIPRNASGLAQDNAQTPRSMRFAGGINLNF